jgi:murein DD-endopeptidase MepM/ murein hydrolase activator NlpD
MGIDLRANSGTEIRSVGDGEITAVKSGGNGGYQVYVRLDNGLEARYMHLENVAGLSQGQRVTAGQVFARTGNSGNTTGPHLHFELLDQNGRHIDPEEIYAGLAHKQGA